MRETFSTNLILKRLNGKVFIKIYNINSHMYTNICEELVARIGGTLHIHFDFGNVFKHSLERILRTYDLVNELSKRSNIAYITQSKNDHVFEYELMRMSPLLVFYHRRDPYDQTNVAYRPALLNGRHVIDVLRCISGQPDVSGEDLEDIKDAAVNVEPADPGVHFIAWNEFV